MEGTFWSDGKLLNLDWGVFKMKVSLQGPHVEIRPPAPGEGISSWGLREVIGAFTRGLREILQAFCPVCLQ